jgi:hypothetical protein
VSFIEILASKWGLSTTIAAVTKPVIAAPQSARSKKAF